MSERLDRHIEDMMLLTVTIHARSACHAMPCRHPPGQRWERHQARGHVVSAALLQTIVQQLLSDGLKVVVQRTVLAHVFYALLVGHDVPYAVTAQDEQVVIVVAF